MLPPAYISWTGHGNQCGEPPGQFTDATMHMFGIDASRAAMQTLVDTLLNSVPGAGASYRCITDHALLTFVDIDKCTTNAEVVGYIPGRECALWVPLLETDGLNMRLVFWAPYIFIDYCIGMVTGREVWGWAKAMARIDMTPAGNPAPSFAARTLIFDKFAATTKGSEQTLIEVTSSASLEMVSAWTTIEDAVGAILGSVSRKTFADLYLDFGPTTSFPAIALKQFRDSAAPKLACFQAIVNSPVRLTRFHGGGFHMGHFQLSVTTCESHQILRDFTGLMPKLPIESMPITFAAWLRFDFEALNGTVIKQSI
jgi:hypothetical protein